MRTLPVLAAILTLAGPCAPAWAEDKSIALLFGPVRPEARETAAATATARIYDWLGAAGTTVELRRAGTREGQELLRFLKPKDVTQALADSARLGGEVPMMRFMDALDLAIYSLARRPGLRYLIVAMQPPPLSADEISRLKETAELCKARKVRVLLWDFSPAGADAATWEPLVGSGLGNRDRDLAKLEAVLPSSTPPTAAAAAVAADAGDSLSVRSHLFRSAPPSAAASGATVGVMSGDFISEAPMAGLRFVEQGGNSSARVRVTQVVKDKAGETVWQARKELSLKSPTSRLAERKTGSLTYIRRLRLTQGDYTLESTLEDLNANSTARSSVSAIATDMLPGLALSGAMIVRRLNKQVDLFEGDDILQYDGVALTPMLSPVFPAGEPFTLSVYFIMFPDMRGKLPRIRLDILQNGQSVGGTALAFSDKLHDDAREGGMTMDGVGEQKHTFPYLAKLADAMLLAGNYEVRVSVRQDSQEVTRSVPFRVVAKAPAK